MGETARAVLLACALASLPVPLSFSAEPQADSYTGGTLNFYDQTKEFGLEGETGLLVAFTSDTFHEVIPVTSGERFTIITWFR